MCQMGHSPQFSTHFYCGQPAGWIKMPLGTEVGLGTGDIVLDGDPAPAILHGHSPPPNFRPMSVVTKLLDESRCPGMVVGLGPGDVVLDGDQIPLKGAQPPVFGPCLLCPNGWMDEDATWYEGRPRPRSQCVRRGPSSTRKGHSTPSFRPMSIVAAVAHLSYC